jgi:hypothetical protein
MYAVGDVFTGEKLLPVRVSDVPPLVGKLYDR